MAELLFEIHTEEIPARMLAKAADDLKKALIGFLTDTGLTFSEIEAAFGPRHLLLYSRDIQAGQEDRVETVTGPPVRIAYDQEGNPTKALEGFLRKNPSLKVEDLFRIEEKKGEIVAGKVEITGRKTIDLLAEFFPDALDKLHFAKNMRWGFCKTRFVRPVHTMVALLDGDVIPFEFAEVRSGNQTFGHRFHGERMFTVSSVDDYLARKPKEGIVVSHEDRLAEIEKQMHAHLEEIGGNLVPDAALLREVADLVELPYVVLGSFDPEFLKIPKEVLITSMREHQKSFSAADEAGNMMPYFMAIASVPGDEKGLIRKGNEWVLNARLWDAKFFWDADLKKDFETLRNKLKDLMFINEIGSYYQKADRMAELAGSMAESLGMSEEEKALAEKAALFAKADLVSELVFEFAELQGNVGGLLLAAKGESQTLSQAVYDHYLPLSMDDDMPRNRFGALVSLADKLDTLVGCFAVGIVPTGTKDPYALRRAAQGITRLLIEHGLPFNLSDLVEKAVAVYKQSIEVPEGLATTIVEFCQDRIRYFLKRKGFDHQLIEAVTAVDMDRVDQTLIRAEAVRAQQEAGNFRTLSLNLKRMNNVVADEIDQIGTFDQALLSDDAEKVLWQQYSELKPIIEGHVAERRYNDAMDTMFRLADPIETYFGTDGVFVNTDDVKIRLNRKSMINQIRLTLGMVADISCLAPKK